MLTDEIIKSMLRDEPEKESIVNKETEEDKLINAFNDKLEEMTNKYIDKVNKKMSELPNTDNENNDNNIKDESEDNNNE